MIPISRGKLDELLRKATSRGAALRAAGDGGHTRGRARCLAEMDRRAPGAADGWYEAVASSR